MDGGRTSGRVGTSGTAARVRVVGRAATVLSVLVAVGVGTHPIASADAPDRHAPLVTGPLGPPAPGLTDGESLGGEDAVEALESADVLSDVAGAAGLDDDELVELLLEDETVFVSSEGRVGFVEAASHGPPAPVTPVAAASLVAAAATTASGLPILDSRPGALRTIFLDFDGYYIHNGSWNTWWGRPPGLTATPYDRSGDPTTFDLLEQLNITQVWRMVAEDFAPFDVNVTTVDPGMAALTGQSSPGRRGVRVVVTNNNFVGAGIAGIAFMNVFGSGEFGWLDASTSGIIDLPAWVFAGASMNTQSMANTASHEAGHTLGLSHDGQTSVAEYYGGHGHPGGWVPIMGSGTRFVSQWSKGEYTNASNTEDDVAILGARLGFAADDHSNSAAGATVIAPNSATTGLAGFGDVDQFIVSSGAGTLTVMLVPEVRAPDWVPNLHAKVEVYDESGDLVAVKLPSGPTSWDSTVTPNVIAGIYRIVVSTVGYGDPTTNGFTDYASAGWYRLMVTAPGGGPSTTSTSTSSTTTSSTTSSTTSTTTTSTTLAPTPPGTSTTTTTTSTTTPSTTTPPAVTTTTTIPPLQPPVPPPASDPPKSSGITAISPVRVLDTRTGLGGSPRPGAGETVTIDLAGALGVTASAAVLNIVAVDPDAPGFLSAVPCTPGRPETSSVNYAAHQVVANTTIATLTGDGKVCIFTSASSDIVVDVTGWLHPSVAGRLASADPGRLADTRKTGRLGAGGVLVVPLPDDAPADTTGVAVNLTVVSPDAAGHLTAYPCGQGRPETSSLNYLGGDVRANNAIIATPGRLLCVYTLVPADVVVDLTGYVAASGRRYVPAQPTRVADTRPSEGGVGPLDPGEARRFRVPAPSAGQAGAAYLNVVAVGHRVPGFTTLYDCGERPFTSTLNQMPGQVVANGATVNLDGGSDFCAYMLNAGDFVADLTGWWVV